jgi:hypothetical protein
MIKNNQNVDDLILGIGSIKNRCSLSDDDIKILDNVVKLLEDMKHERSEKLRAELFAKALNIMMKFFGDDISNCLDGLM